MTLLLATAAAAQHGEWPTMAELADCVHVKKSRRGLDLIDDSDTRWPILETKGQFVVVQVEGARLEIDFRMLASAGIPALAPRLQRLRKAGLDVEPPLRLQYVPTLGPVLRTESALVTSSRVWQRESAASSTDLRPETTAVQAACAQLQAKLAEHLDPVAASSLQLALEVLFDVERANQLELDVVRLRQRIRHGWLQHELGAVADDLTHHMRAACTPVRTSSWKGNGHELVELQDAFGNVTWLRREQNRLRLAVRPPQPQFAAMDFAYPADGWLVYQLPATSAPLADDAWRDQIEAATMFECGIEIARWRSSGTLTVDPEVWRTFVPMPEDANGVLPEQLPPHIVFVDPRGDVFGLATRRGLLRPPADASAAEGERFLRDAADRLVGANELDLLGQYLVAYAHDSLDPRRPSLPGTVLWKGDQHQTSLVTLATALGGICHGDCDDLAELYVDILRRQGRLAHVLSLREHAGAVWVEPYRNRWRATMLHSGSAMTFVGSDARKALATLQAQAGEPYVEARQLALLERFDDELQRTEVRVGPEVFTEAEAAQELRRIDECLLAGLCSAAEDLLAARSDDGGPSLLGRWATLAATRGEATRAHAAQLRVLASASTTNGRVLATMDALQTARWYAPDSPQVAGLTWQLARVAIPEFRSDYHRRLQATFDVCWLLSSGRPDPALTEMAPLLTSHLDLALTQLRTTNAPPDAGSSWVADLFAALSAPTVGDYSPAELRDLAGSLVDHLLTCCEWSAADWSLRPRVMQMLATWREEAALRDGFGPTPFADLVRLGRLWVLECGDAAVLAKVVDGTVPAPQQQPKPEHRAESLLAGWLRASPMFWVHLMQDRMLRRRPLDGDEWRLLVSAWRAASAAATTHGWSIHVDRWSSTAPDIFAAVQAREERGIDQAFAELASRNDASERAAALTILCAAVHHVPIAEWRTVVASWGRHLPSRAAYFPHAWALLRAGHPEHAIALGEAAVARFGEQTWARELAALRAAAPH